VGRREKERRLTAEQNQRDSKAGGLKAADEEGPRHKLSVGRKMLFGLVTVAGLIGGLEVVLALCGVRPVLYSEDPFVGFASNIPLYVEKTDSSGHKVLVTSPNKLKFFNGQEFPKVKRPGTYRIFCLGGSTTYGRPFWDMTSFCGWLRELLAVADPSRTYEVINAGGISYASYRVALVMEELSQYDPDLFIVYSGHNEFLERRTYHEIRERSGFRMAAEALLCRLRTYSALRRTLDSVVNKPTGQEAERYTLPGEVVTLLDHAVGLSAYTRDDTLKEQVLEHYRFNLNRMVDIARSSGAEIILVTPASNLRDCSPFKSEHREGLTGRGLERWENLYRQAQQLREKGERTEAVARLEQAEAIDDRFADLYFLKGRILYELGRYPEAKEAWIHARDEDICPLRALTSMVESVSEVAASRGVPLVDFAGMIAEHSEHSIPGSGYFFDHVHPTIAGHRMLALALIDVLEDRGVVRTAPTWNEQAIESVVRGVESKIDDEAQVGALQNLARVLGWSGKTEEARRVIGQALEVRKDDVRSLYMAGTLSQQGGDLAAAVRYYRQVLRSVPRHLNARKRLGMALAKQGKMSEAIAHFSEALQIKPDDAKAHACLGKALYAQGRVAEAVTHLSEALRIRPDDAGTHNDLGVALLAQGKTAEAVTQFHEALRIDPNYALARDNLREIP
jgi:tetratricopeptide (TPR) repeat protein